MKKVILIKYGELTTKKGNRNYFVQLLYERIKKKLESFPISIQKDLSRMYITLEEKDVRSVLEKLQTVFGIHEYYVATLVDSTKESIIEALKKMIQEAHFTTFKVEVKRSDKTFPIPSMEFAKELGSIVLKNTNSKKVDVHNPDLLIHVEIRENESFLYTDVYKGLGGYPVGVQGTGLLMLSGGIDSPVAGYLSQKRGIKIEAVYFEALPHTSLEAREKVISLAKVLAKYQNEIKLHIVPFTQLQEEIYRNGKKEYTITIMRRMMYRIMEQLCRKQHAKCFINGESIGQVASQTLSSMEVINAVTNLPVIRPVACLDKLEIMNLARNIGTYDISILPYEDCCTVFVPKHPIIHPSLEECSFIEKNLNFEKILEETIENTFVLKIKEEQDEKFKDIL